MTYRKKLIMRKHRIKAKKVEEKQKLAKAQAARPGHPIQPPAKAT
jgi:hypothetical protein